MINVQIYGNANAVTNTVTVEFLGDIMSGSFTPVSTAAEYFIRLSTSATDTSRNRYTPKLVLSLGDLALNGNVQSASNTSADYTTVKAMIEDYIYDYIYGHTANQYASGCTVQNPMRF